TEPILQGNITEENLFFSYPETGIKVIENLSLTVKRWQTHAIIEKTGSGKGTLPKLLMRTHDADQRHIYYDGLSLQDIKTNALRSQIGFVPQQVFLFSDTIANNIAFGLDTLEMDKVEQAAKDAAVYDNVMNFDNGFQTSI